MESPQLAVFVEVNEYNGYGSYAHRDKMMSVNEQVVWENMQLQRVYCIDSCRHGSRNHNK